MTSFVLARRRPSLSVIAAGMVAVMSTPASATNRSGDSADAKGDSLSRSTDGKEVKGAVRISYCIISTFTGSRIPQKVCKSRKDWEAEGVELPADGRGG